MSVRAPIWLFCRVIDNFGDAGVCWRLARQLSCEYGMAVSLFIDAPGTLKQLAPEVAIDGAPAPAPLGADLRVIEWTDADPAQMLAHAHPQPLVVISGFGCDLPEAVRAALGPRDGAPPIWINLEYLSAEDWVPQFHGRPSPKPSDQAVEHFYFPGFTPSTGGLLRERGLEALREPFQASMQARDFLASIGITLSDEGEPPRRRISLFCYRSAPLAAWFEALADDTQRTLLLVTAPVAGAAFAAAGAPPDAQTWSRGALELRRVPMLSQPDYDRLLWSCDLNMVRGEDSWIRAHWAARPFIWQPYPQTDSTHLLKLEAFMALIQNMLDHDAAIVPLHKMMRAWSSGTELAEAWSAYRTHEHAIAELLERWRRYLLAQTDLSSRLLEFIGDRLK